MQPFRRLLILMALACVGSVAAALWTQYHWNMQPCPWCILQRVLFLLIAVLAILGALAPGRVLPTLLSWLVVPVAASGVASAWYQHFVAAKTNSCNLTLADRIVSGLHLDTALPGVFEVRASCADAAANLFGVPFEFWSLALFVMVAVAAVWCALRAQRAST